MRSIHRNIQNLGGARRVKLQSSVDVYFSIDFYQVLRGAFPSIGKQVRHQAPGCEIFNLLRFQVL